MTALVASESGRAKASCERQAQNQLNLYPGLLHPLYFVYCGDSAARDTGIGIKGIRLKPLRQAPKTLRPGAPAAAP